jgi:hypothetical protein
MQAHMQGTFALFRLRTAAVDVEQKVEVRWLRKLWGVAETSKIRLKTS